MGEIAKMEEAYQLAADLAEEKWQAWWNAGCFHLDRTGDLVRAKRYLETALEAAPERQEIWYMLAKLHKKAKSYPEEKRCLEKLFDFGNRDTMVLNRLALLRIESGEEAQAIEALERSPAD